MTQINVKHISKAIHSQTVLNDISLELNSGKIYGFVGKNGSGKTMLFRAISGLMRIDSGEIMCDGQLLGKDIVVLPSVGIVLENAGLYMDKTGYQNLKYLASLKGNTTPEQIRNAIVRVGLDPDDKRTYRKYSLGMKQRIAIAQAIMEEPDVILLDEPTNALDAEGVQLIRNVILEEKERGALILIASHVREDIELLADEVYTIDAGKIIGRNVKDE